MDRPNQKDERQGPFAPARALRGQHRAPDLRVWRTRRIRERFDERSLSLEPVHPGLVAAGYSGQGPHSQILLRVGSAKQLRALDCRRS